MRKRFISLLACGALAATSLVGFAACGGGDSNTHAGTTEDPYKLTLWGPIEQQSMLAEMVATFKAQNKDKVYDIEIGVCSEADAYTNLKTDATQGADVYAFANDQINNLLRVGALAEVTGSNKTAVENDNGLGAVNAAKVGSKLYAYPYTADNGYFLVYDDETVSEDQAKTLEGVLTACQTAGKRFVFDLDNSWYVAGFFFGAGCTYNTTFDDAGKPTTITCDFDDPVKGTLAAKAMLQLKESPAFLNGDDSAITSGAADTSLGACVTGMWNIPDSKDDDGNPVYHLEHYWGDHLKATKLPTVTVGSDTFQLGSFAGYKLYGVNPNAADLTEAHRLAAFLSGAAMQTKRFQAIQAGPSNTSVANTPAVKANKGLAALSAQGVYATAQTAVPDNFWSAAETFGTEVCNGKVTTENLSAKLKTMADLIKTISTD